MDDLLAGQTAVVTGAASGNGRGIAVRFAECGADVVVADIRKTPRQGGTPTHERINDETSSRAVFVECDVTNTDDLQDAVIKAEELGGIDIMVNNAGFSRQEDFAELAEDAYHEMMDVNLKGVCFGSQVAIRAMTDREAGSIINISSLSGLLGSPNSAIYSASKGGVRLFTYAIAARYGSQGIRANVLHPGVVDTAILEDIGLDDEGREKFAKRIPLRRVAKPSDIGNAALFLASDLSSYVSGTSLVVDGGYHSSF